MSVFLVCFSFLKSSLLIGEKKNAGLCSRAMQKVLLYLPLSFIPTSAREAMGGKQHVLLAGVGALYQFLNVSG